MQVWTLNDRRFLRSMRIASSDPPDPLPRFRVEPSRVEGYYAIVDAERKWRSTFEFGGKEFPDPRAAAENYAAQLNAKPVDTP